MIIIVQLRATLLFSQFGKWAHKPLWKWFQNMYGFKQRLKTYSYNEARPLTLRYVKCVTRNTQQLFPHILNIPQASAPQSKECNDPYGSMSCIYLYACRWLGDATIWGINKWVIRLVCREPAESRKKEWIVIEWVIGASRISTWASYDWDHFYRIKITFENILQWSKHQL